jgi:TDG/mug DNA glycosylase family protein
MRAARAVEQIAARASAVECFRGFFPVECAAVDFLLVISIYITPVLTSPCNPSRCIRLSGPLVYGRFIMVSKRVLSDTEQPFKPTKQQLLDAAGKTVPDVIAPGLRVLFCGINPGLYTAAVGHHFARPGNRFWPALYKSGFTDRLLSPFAERELLQLRLGVTNVVAHATAAASELTREDILKGGGALKAKVRRYRPRVIAILGMGAYRQAFAQPKATIGEQAERIGDTRVWVLPNPSGLNANYQLPDLVRIFSKLRAAAEAEPFG